MGSNGTSRLPKGKLKISQSFCFFSLTLTRLIISLVCLALAAPAISLTFSVNLAFPSGSGPERQNFVEIQKEKIKQALQLGNYFQAIALCLEGLKTSPQDYELNFWLSQAYAFSKKWDRALERVAFLKEKYADNSDVLLLEARILSWKKDYSAASKQYQNILQKDPQNLEARIGLTQVASWEGKYAEAIVSYHQLLAEYPDNAELHYLFGLTLFWSGNLEQARRELKRAVELASENKVYREAYNRSLSVFQKTLELRSALTVETFSDGRADYLDLALAAEARIPPSGGSIILTGEETKRFGTLDRQAGLELYPRLWPQAYGFFYFKASSKATHFPQNSYHLELFQGFARRLEFSLGFQKMNFKNKPVSIYLGSWGAYFGNYYGYLRWYYSPEKIGSEFSWTANFRRYWRQESFIFVAYGQGARAYNVISFSDLLARQSTLLQAGVDAYLWHHLRLRAQITRRGEGKKLTRYAYSLTLGGAW